MKLFKSDKCYYPRSRGARVNKTVQDDSFNLFLTENFLLRSKNSIFTAN